MTHDHIVAHGANVLGQHAGFSVVSLVLPAYPYPTSIKSELSESMD